MFIIFKLVSKTRIIGLQFVSSCMMFCHHIDTASQPFNQTVKIHLKICIQDVPNEKTTFMVSGKGALRNAYVSTQPGAIVKVFTESGSH